MNYLSSYGLTGALLLAISGTAIGGQDKIDVCHITSTFNFGNGDVPIGNVINIADPAFPAHVDHGDPEAWAIIELGDDTEACTASVEDTEKVVFVTTNTFNGNLGGLAGADAKCNAAASVASLPGTYTAWLSDSLTDARDRVTQATVPYVRTDGVQVADDFADIVTLLAGGVCGPSCLQNAINLDQFGTPASFANVWTATDPDGVKNLGLGTCSDWTSNQSGEGGGIGLNTFVTEFWTRGGIAGCQAVPWVHLYCFQD